jgi:hypothetical protein
MFKKKSINYKVILCIGFFMVLLIFVMYYNKNLSRDGIYHKVLNRDGYEIHEVQKPVNFTVYIEPTWIPNNKDEVIELNKVIKKVGKVEILLESIMHRGNDIYFNFDARPFINYDSGEFLYHYIFNEDGTATSYILSDSFNIYNKNTKIDVGQRGFGPDSKFSFGINIENYDAIKDGFTLEYNSSILYGYSLID